ncbi:hypothetical protein JTE90_006914 [Oedothorax gibbosus]|uniref:Uncharacterized protein n=1 Tax=Oedothorax gibbosus TaxID=931172 RepID=A0AAV6VPN2_9ARAC|nr:hypothetical protein JTE90_006914 [Oedothorax gibbosus]
MGEDRLDFGKTSLCLITPIHLKQTPNLSMGSSRRGDNILPTLSKRSRNRGQRRSAAGQVTGQEGWTRQRRGCCHKRGTKKRSGRSHGSRKGITPDHPCLCG